MALSTNNATTATATTAATFTTAAVTTTTTLPKPIVALAYLTHCFEVNSPQTAVAQLDQYIQLYRRSSSSNTISSNKSGSGGGGTVAVSGSSPSSPYAVTKRPPIRLLLGRGSTPVIADASPTSTSPSSALHHHFLNAVDSGLLHPDDTRYLALCHARLGEWRAHLLQEQQRPFDNPAIEEILKQLRAATMLDKSNGELWHKWAHMHRVLIDRVGDRYGTLDDSVMCALQGYLKSMSLDPQLQDILGFLSLWFSHASNNHNGGGGGKIDLEPALQGISQVQPNVWLRVLPQIIARIHTSNVALNEQVYHLLSIVAKYHPQALLYSLNVSSGAGGGSSDPPGVSSPSQPNASTSAMPPHNSMNLVPLRLHTTIAVPPAVTAAASSGNRHQPVSECSHASQNFITTARNSFGDVIMSSSAAPCYQWSSGVRRFSVRFNCGTRWAAAGLEMAIVRSSAGWCSNHCLNSWEETLSNNNNNKLVLRMVVSEPRQRNISSPSTGRHYGTPASVSVTPPPCHNAPTKKCVTPLQSSPILWIGSSVNLPASAHWRCK